MLSKILCVHVINNL